MGQPHITIPLTFEQILALVQQLSEADKKKLTDVLVAEQQAIEIAKRQHIPPVPIIDISNMKLHMVSAKMIRENPHAVKKVDINKIKEIQRKFAELEKEELKNENA